MNRKKYLQRHYRNYCLRKKRVTITLDMADYKALEKRAGDRSPGQQLWLESLGYRQERYLPPRSVETRIEALQLGTARLYDALQTHQTSILGKIPSYPEAIAGLRSLNVALDQFLIKPGRR